MLRHQAPHNRVTGFVVGCHSLLFIRHHHGATFRAHHDLIFRFIEFFHRHNTLVVTRCEQCSFVHQVRQISTRETRRTARNHRRVYIIAERNFAHVDLKNLLTTTNIRQTYRYLTVEASRTQQRWVKHIWAVSSSDNNNTFVAFKTIHLN